MRTSTLLLAALLLSSTACASLQAADAPPCAQTTDWLINPAPFKAQVKEDKAKHQLILDNGLARRVIQLTPNAATLSLENLTSREHMLRAIAPEARLTLDGTAYAVGGLTGAPIANFIDATWLAQIRPFPIPTSLRAGRKKSSNRASAGKSARNGLPRTCPGRPPASTS